MPWSCTNGRTGRPAATNGPSIAVMPVDRIVEAVLGLEAVAEALQQDARGCVRRTTPRSAPGAACRAAHRRCRAPGRHARASTARRRCARPGRPEAATRRSGEVSTRMVLPRSCTRMEQRRRRLRGSAGVGGTPFAVAALAPYPRYATRRAAAQDRHPHLAASTLARSALANSRKKLSVVAASSSATPTPLSSATLAAVWATKAGSLVLPRLGTGAR